MAPKIFLTGATGYIGGSTLHAIISTHPEYEITVLLRDDPPSTFSSTYPNVKVVQGDYSSLDILSSAAEHADVVVHMGNSDHETALNAFLTGLLKKPTPGYLLHLSGTGIVSDWSSEEFLGELNPRIWSDETDIPAIASLPDHALHRNTEKILHAAISEHADKVNIAIMCPPDIYGKGHGLVRTQSVLIPYFVKATQEQIGQPFYYGSGSNTRSWVHIQDLMRLYVHVVEAAVAGDTSAFGSNGYYFAGTQEYSQKEIAQATADIMHKHGLIANNEISSITLEQLDSVAADRAAFPKLARYLFASNSRTRAHRAEKRFEYKASAPSLMDTSESDVLDAVKG